MPSKWRWILPLAGVLALGPGQTALATPASDAAKQLVGRWSADVKQSEPAGFLRMIYVFDSTGHFQVATTHSGFPNQRPYVTGGSYAVTDGGKGTKGIFVLTTIVVDNDDKPETLQTAAEFSVGPKAITFADATVLKRE